jgi:hypothetical protein
MAFGRSMPKAAAVAIDLEIGHSVALKLPYAAGSMLTH